MEALLGWHVDLVVLSFYVWGRSGRLVLPIFQLCFKSGELLLELFQLFPAALQDSLLRVELVPGYQIQLVESSLRGRPQLLLHVTTQGLCAWGNDMVELVQKLVNELVRSHGWAAPNKW
jgi:hypothetical protein